MLLVVPPEKILAECAAVGETAEAIRELRTVLQGPELAFRIRVVIGYIRSAVGLGDAEIGHEEGHRLGRHDPATVGVDVELTGGNLVLANGLLNELLGQFRALPMHDHPADGIATEDVEDDIEIEIGPFGRTQQFGNVPAPKLVGGGG
jgi:hypothetical protein